MALISASIGTRESSGGEGEAVPSNGGRIVAVAGTLMGVTFIVVSLRLYVRQMILKSFSIDDAVIIVALIMAIISMVCFVEMVQHGAGRCPTDIKKEWREGLAYWTYILGYFLITGIGLVKISIGFLLKRFAQTPGQRRFLWSLILFLSVFVVYSDIMFSISCVPLRAHWVPGLRAAPTTKCQTMPVVSIIGTVNGVINALTDVIFCLLPVPVVLTLRINRRTRATLFLILSLGLFACAASVARMIFGRQRLKDPQDTGHVKFQMWFYIELQVGILATSLPTLRPIFIKLLKGAPRNVLPSGSYRFGTSPTGYGPTTRSNPCQCGEPQYSWSVQGRGNHRGGHQQTPLHSVITPGGRCENIVVGGGNNNEDKNNDPNRSRYKAAQVSSSSATRHVADSDSEKGGRALPPGGIRVSRRTEITYNADMGCTVDEMGERCGADSKETPIKLA